MKKALSPRVAVLPLAAALLVAVPSAASATVYAGSTTDAADGRYAATDVRMLSVSIDDRTGTWTTTLRFRRAPVGSTRAQIYLSFVLKSVNKCNDKQGGYVELSVRGTKTTSLLHDQCLADDPATAPKVERHRHGATLTIVVRDARLVGLQPDVFNPTRISYRTIVQDNVPGFGLVPSPPVA